MVSALLVGRAGCGGGPGTGLRPPPSARAPRGPAEHSAPAQCGDGWSCSALDRCRRRPRAGAPPPMRRADLRQPLAASANRARATPSAASVRRRTNRRVRAPRGTRETWPGGRSSCTTERVTPRLRARVPRCAGARAAPQRLEGHAATVVAALRRRDGPRAGARARAHLPRPKLRGHAAPQPARPTLDADRRGTPRRHRTFHRNTIRRPVGGDQRGRRTGGLRGPGRPRRLRGWPGRGAPAAIQCPRAARTRAALRAGAMRRWLELLCSRPVQAPPARRRTSARVPRGPAAPTRGLRQSRPRHPLRLRFRPPRGRAGDVRVPRGTRERSSRGRCQRTHVRGGTTTRRSISSANIRRRRAGRGGTP